MGKIPCSHCNIVFEERALIKDESFDESKYFCCTGCQRVYHLLKSEGLDSFYEKLKSVSLEPPANNPEDALNFDSEPFLKRYARQRPDGLMECYLILEHIHCVACIWLNEKILGRTDGVLEANINYSNNKAKIVWDPSVTRLSAIIEKIRRVGYDAKAYDPALQESGANKIRKTQYYNMMVALFCTMNIMWIAIALYAGFFEGIEQQFKNILHFAEFLLATPTLFYSGSVFYRGAYYGVKNGTVNMDTLVATGASLTYAYSIYAALSMRGEPYFDSVTMIVTFVLIGKFLESISKKQAIDVLDRLSAGLPVEVAVVRAEGIVNVAVDSVLIGEMIELKAGDKVAIDGVIIQGEASFDESNISGEATPVVRGVHSEILGGSVNLDGVVRYEAKRDFANSNVSKIIRLLEEASSKKPHIEQLANTLSRYFSATILSISLLTFACWLYFTGRFELALINAVSVIVIACPCALALATPIATLVGLGVAARSGVIFKAAKFLETISKATVVVLDKTGTITEGRPKVMDEKQFLEFDKNALFALLSSSKHPVSKGVAEHLSLGGEMAKVQIDNLKEERGKGISALYGGRQLLGGSAKFVREQGVLLPEIDSDKTLFYYCEDKKLCAVYELADAVKNGAREGVQKLKSYGLKVIMLTGDTDEAAATVANSVGIDSFKAKMNPEQKYEYIKQLQSGGNIVIMAGDGINDSLALSASDIGVAMGSGADVALEVSDVAVPDDSFEGFVKAYEIGRKTFRTVRQNIGFSLAYNSVTIPLAVSGFVIPLFAALSMSLSSLIVVLNSMRIKTAFEGR